MAGVVKQLSNGSASVMDKICPKLLKPLDVVGMTCLCKIVWTLETWKWQTGVLVPLFKNGYSEDVVQLPEDHAPQPLWDGLLQGDGEESLAVW